MYHVELRQFPFTACRFNLNDRDLLALLDPWVHDKWIDLDERKWSPQQARITVLEGPELPVYELSMGRGWRSAERRSKDVTAQVLERVRALLLEGPGGDGARAGGGTTGPGVTVAGATGPAGASGSAPAVEAGGGGGGGAAGEAVGGGEAGEAGNAGAGVDAGSGRSDLRALLGDDPGGLLQAWQLVAQRRPELSPSESLALAEQTLRSLG